MADTELAMLKLDARAMLRGLGVDEKDFLRRASRLRGKKGTEAAKLRGAVWRYRTGKLSDTGWMAFLVKWTTEEQRR
jgi:hypothetical protein